MTQLEKHQRAIRVLELIDLCQFSIDRAKRDMVLSMDWYKERIQVNEKMKARLQNYYNNNFKI